MSNGSTPSNPSKQHSCNAVLPRLKSNEINNIYVKFKIHTLLVYLH
jgi:hypothetical protein